MTIEPVSSLFGWFRNVLHDATVRRRVDVGGETTDYLANLLATSAHPDRASALLDRSIVLTLDEALSSSPGEQFVGLQAVGDASLYLVSFFPDHLERAQLDPTLYVSVGALAYGRAAEIARVVGTREPGVLVELNAKFPVLVDVLGEVAESAALGSVTRDLVKLFDRWKATGSDRALAAMARAGAFPGRGGHAC
jgi:hypothetical protein